LTVRKDLFLLNQSNRVPNPLLLWGVPPWFKPFGEFTGLLTVPHWSKFFTVDSETGIKLNGMPDDIFKMADGRYFIVDYKTAKFTDNQDKLLPLYVVQLNGYAYGISRTPLLRTLNS
jgi:hypothetical protein